MTCITKPASMLAATEDSLRNAGSTGARTHYDTLETTLDAVSLTHWCHMRPQGRPCFSADLLRDCATVHQTLRTMSINGASPRYHVLASRTPGVFNLGGDLVHFADRIRADDRAGLRRYGEACIRIAYDNHIACNLPMITIALVQGDALGGGFESALAHDLIVAERSAKFGLPEILFNLFPGMGATSFLNRKIGAVAAERLIMSGRLYTAEELHMMGVVDVLAEDGEGEVAVRRLIAESGRKHNAHLAIYRARRRANPVTFAELSDIVDIWIDAALAVGELDLRKMQRLAMAQERRIQATPQMAYGVAAE